jgi:hypothetical protein
MVDRNHDHDPLSNAATPGCIKLKDGTQICDEAVLRNAGE